MAEPSVKKQAGPPQVFLAPSGGLTRSGRSGGAFKPETDTIEVQICWAPENGAAQLSTIRLPRGATLGEALNRSGLDLPHASWRVEGGDLRLAVFGVLQPANALAQEGDRIDITRPLTVDPKDARRARARKAAAQRRAQMA